MTASGPWVVEARGLVKRFGAETVVDRIDLHVPRGGCFGLLGPNGAGKTTTLRMILGHSPPSGGHAHRARRADARRRTAGSRPDRSRVPGRQPRSRLHGDAEPRGLRLVLPAAPAPAAAAVSRIAPRVRLAGGPRRVPDPGPVRRDAPAPGDRPGPGERARAAHPRRADDRPRSPDPPSHLVAPSGAHRARHHRPPHHPLHGGGGAALRPGGDHRSGTDPRRGRPACADRAGGRAERDRGAGGRARTAARGGPAGPGGDGGRRLGIAIRATRRRSSRPSAAIRSSSTCTARRTSRTCSCGSPGASSGTDARGQGFHRALAPSRAALARLRGVAAQRPGVGAPGGIQPAVPLRRAPALPARPSASVSDASSATWTASTTSPFSRPAWSPRRR